MKISVEKVNATRVKSVASCDAAELAKFVTSIKQELTASADIPGFRKGKAPWGKVMQRYQKEYTEELNRKVVVSLLRESIKEGKLDYYTLVNTEDLKIDETTGASITLTIDVRPEVKAPALNKISIKKADPQVSEKEIDDRISYFRGMMATFGEATAEDVVGEQDLIGISFSSNIDPESVSAEAKHWVKDDEYWVQIREDAFIPGLKDLITGHKQGEALEHKVTYPKDFHVTDLAGKKVVYQITIKSLRKQKPADDATVLQRLGVASMEEMRKLLKDSMLAEATQKEQMRVQHELEDALIESTKVDLPESELEESTEQEMGRILSRMGQIPEAEIKAQRDKIMETAKKAATHLLQVRYILLAIARDRKLELTKEEFEAELDHVAEAEKMTRKQVVNALFKNDRMDLFNAVTLANKTIKILADELAK